MSFALSLRTSTSAGREQIFSADLRKFPIASQEISTLTNGSHNVHRLDRRAGSTHWRNFMVGAVEGRAKKVVHRCIHNREMFPLVVLGVKHGSQQHARRSDQNPAWFQQEVEMKAAEGLQDLLRVLRGVSGEIGQGTGLVVDSQPSTRVDVTNVVSRRTQLLDEAHHSPHRQPERSHLHDLRPDVYAHTCHIQITAGRCPWIKPPSLLDGNAKLVFPQAS
jgi:hypothetical protein